MLHIIPNSFIQHLRKLVKELYEHDDQVVKIDIIIFKFQKLISFELFFYKQKIHDHCLIVYNYICMEVFIVVSLFSCFLYINFYQRYFDTTRWAELVGESGFILFYFVLVISLEVWKTS